MPQEKALNEQSSSGHNVWQPKNPLKHLSMRAAFPLGAGARGGWRLGLSQSINEHLSVDARLRGGHASRPPVLSKVEVIAHTQIMR